MPSPTENRYFRQTVLVIGAGMALFGALEIIGYYAWLRNAIAVPPWYYVLQATVVVFSLILLLVARSFFLSVRCEIRAVGAAQERLREAYSALMDAFIVALDTRDHETHGHAIRVVALALAIGERMGCTPEQRHATIWGGLLHDIGKIGVPDSILRKPGALTGEERHVMMQHTVIGYRMVRRVRVLQEATNVVLYHHERWDGTGYPSGIAGAEIPLVARIFAVADAVDAMVSARPYKKRRQLAEVYTEVERCSGTQFCPAAAQAFLSIPRDEVAGILATAQQSMVDDTWLERVTHELVAAPE